MVCLQVVELFQEFFFHKMVDEIFDGFQVMYRPGSCYLCIDDLLDCESVVLCVTHLFDKVVLHSKSDRSNFNYH